MDWQPCNGPVVIFLHYFVRGFKEPLHIHNKTVIKQCTLLFHRNGDYRKTYTDLKPGRTYVISIAMVSRSFRSQSDLTAITSKYLPLLLKH